MGNCLKRAKNQQKNDQKSENNDHNILNSSEKKPEIKDSKAKAPKSWELRPKLNKEDYQFKNKENQLLVKKPGFLILKFGDNNY